MDLNLVQVIEEVSRSKGISQDLISTILEESMKEAAKKFYSLDLDADVQAFFNEETGEVEVFEFRQVVLEITDDKGQILLEDAIKQDPEVLEGDDLGIQLDTTPLGRIAAQKAKQVITKQLRQAENTQVFEEFCNRKGELVTGSVRRIERKKVYIDLNRTEGILYPDEQLPKEIFRKGDRVLAYIKDVVSHKSRETGEVKGTEILLSRAANEFVSKLFEMHVPEISEGIVEIMGIARDPGSRSKVAVFSKESDVDPLGACVGIRGSRVQAIVQELKGEKIDIVPFDSEHARFVCNALSPAIVSRVLIDEGTKTMEIIVPDDQLSLAIGRKGQNVSLAAQLTGWKIDITSETKLYKQKELVKESFKIIDSLDESYVELFFNYRIRSIQDLARLSDEVLQNILPGMSSEKAKIITRQARKFAAQQKTEEEPKTPYNVQKSKILSYLDGKKIGEETQKDRLLMVEGIDQHVIEQLKLGGIETVEALASHDDFQKLAEVTGLDDDLVDELLDNAERYLNVEKDLLNEGY